MLSQFTNSHAYSANETFMPMILHESHLSASWQEGDHQDQTKCLF